MRALLLSAALISPLALAEQSMWFTILGDATDPAVDTVEVDVTRAVAFDAARLVRLRVNRAQPRVGFDGKLYHSYYSTAVVDCTARTAWHRSLWLFSQPLWRGSMRVLDYEQHHGRNVVFAEMPHNPKDRLIRAACAISLQSR